MMVVVTASTESTVRVLNRDTNPISKLERLSNFVSLLSDTGTYSLSFKSMMVKVSQVKIIFQKNFKKNISNPQTCRISQHDTTTIKSIFCGWEKVI